MSLDTTAYITRSHTDFCRGGGHTESHFGVFGTFIVESSDYAHALEQLSEVDSFVYFLDPVRLLVEGFSELALFIYAQRLSSFLSPHVPHLVQMEAAIEVEFILLARTGSQRSPVVKAHCSQQNSGQCDGLHGKNQVDIGVEAVVADSLGELNETLG